MPNAFPRSPKLIKGALIELSEPFLGPVPNIIAFQYNPEKIDRKMTPWTAAAQGGGTYWEEPKSNWQTFDQAESLFLSLELDAFEALEVANPVAFVSGVADRFAALEMLLYPVGKRDIHKIISSLNLFFVNFGRLIRE